MKYKHLFFDMDGTISLTRSKITFEMKSMLKSILQKKIDIIVISGSHNEQMKFQTENLPIIKMGQNGNHTVHPKHGELWCDTMTEQQKDEVIAHTNAIWAECSHIVPDINDLFEDRGSQISFSLYGHNANIQEKKSFDANFEKRKSLLKKIPYKSDETEVKIGGSTTFDYIKKGKNKGYNVAKIIKHFNWDKKECMFYGDALFPGGNDETVTGIIKTVEVTDEEDCLCKLKSLYK